MLLNLFCGMIWSPFTHLAANVIQRRYGMPEESASNSASYLLAGPLVLYPLCGYLVDKFKHRPIVIQLLLLSSGLTMAAYAWFSLNPSLTKTPVPGIFLFAFGHGFAPLLLVVLVPRIVPFKYISTALGAHKSLEQTGSTLFQTLSGLLLDVKRADVSSLQSLLNIFLFLNVVQCCSILLLALLQWRKKRNAPPEILSETAIGLSDSERAPLFDDHHRQNSSGSSTVGRRGILHEHRTPSELRRGKIFARASVVLVGTAWVLFLTTAWYRLGEKRKGK